MGNRYSYQEYKKDNMAKAIGRSVPISIKQSIEICNLIRGKTLGKVKILLNDVIKERQAVPFRRFNSDVGHKNKIGPGRYPKKASKEILDLVNLAEANAQFKGLNTSNLEITHINANKASTVTRFGRKRSRKAKRTNIELVVKEKAVEKKAEKTIEKSAKQEIKQDKK